MNNNRTRYAWDYDITQEQFDKMLAGRREVGHLNRGGILADGASFEPNTIPPSISIGIKRDA